MALTKVVGGVIADTTITSTDILDSTITNAKMALSPANASNLSSGSVPAAQLTLAPDPDLTAQKGDIALLAFKTQANGNLARYNLVDQSVDAFEDATGVDAGASTNATRTSSNYYQGFVAGTDPTGGTETSYTGYKVHSFTNTGNTNFVVSSAGNVDVLVVAGGGGGGAYGGAGGAGGFRTSASHAVTAQTYVVTVGTGGAGSSGGTGSVGVNSVFDSITSAGGGLGGNASTDGGDGGSGGGGGYDSDGGSGNTPSTSPAQGYGGGLGGANTAQYPSGGGGGAGGVGQAASIGSGAGGNWQNAGNGGVGAQNLYRTGSNVYYASGGGGGVPYGGGYGTSTIAGTASDGGGGSGGRGENGTAGTPNTGGGGGGGAYNGSTSSARNGGAGGSGIVVIRYEDGAFGTPNNMTLVSNSTTAQAAPTKGDLVFTYSNGAGTAVVGTNITAEYSADNGSTWTDFGIGASDVQGTTGGHTIVSKNDVSLTSTSGTTMVYRIKTLVQSASLATRIHAVSLGWS